MNECFEREIKYMISRIRKINLLIIIFSLIILFCSISLLFIVVNFIYLLLLFIALMNMIVIYLYYIFKKQLTKILNNYQTNREEAINYLEKYVLKYQKRTRNKMIMHATNALNALKEL